MLNISASKFYERNLGIVAKFQANLGELTKFYSPWNHRKTSCLAQIRLILETKFGNEAL